MGPSLGSESHTTSSMGLVLFLVLSSSFSLPSFSFRAQPQVFHPISTSGALFTQLHSITPWSDPVARSVLSGTLGRGLVCNQLYLSATPKPMAYDSTKERKEWKGK